MIENRIAPCPYKECPVVRICSVLYRDRQFPDSVDEIGLVTDVNILLVKLDNYSYVTYYDTIN